MMDGSAFLQSAAQALAPNSQQAPANGNQPPPTDPNAGQTITYDSGDGSGPKTGVIAGTALDKTTGKPVGYNLASGDFVGAALAPSYTMRQNSPAAGNPNALPSQQGAPVFNTLDILNQGATGNFKYTPPSNPAAEAAKEQPIDTPTAIAQGALNSATLGLGNKAIAAGKALYDTATTGAPFGQQFTENANILQQLQGQNTQASPYAEIGGNVAGAMLPGGMIAKILPKISTLAGGVTQATTLGAGLGGAQAANESDWSNPQQVAENALEGAGVGGLLGGATGLVGAAFSPVKRLLGNMGWASKTAYGPNGQMATDAQAQNAGNIIRQNVGEAHQITNAIEGQAPGLVPGEQPTLGQTMPNPSTVALEETLKRGEAKPQFAQRAEENNLAGISALNNLQPEGNPYSVGHWFNQRLTDLDNQAAQETQGAVENTQNATAALGAPKSPIEVGAAARGQTLAAEVPVRAQTNALWQKLKGYGLSSSVVTNRVRQWAQSLTQADLAAADAGPERSALAQLQSWPDVTPFDEIRAISSQLGDAASEAARGGNRAAAFRINGLKQALHGALSDGIDADAVNEGKGSLYDELVNERNRWIAGKPAAEEVSNIQGRGDAGGSAGGVSAGSAETSVRGGTGAASQAGRQSGALAGNPRVEGLEPVGPDQVADYQIARKASQAQIERFHERTVGDITKAGDEKTEATLNGELVKSKFALADSELPGKIWHPGTKQVESARDFLDAGGKSETLKDAAALTLRDSGAVKPDGTLEVKDFDRWRAAHRHVLADNPEIAKAFDNAREAQLSIERASANRMQAVKDFQSSEAKHFLGDRDPDKAVKAAFNAPDSAKEFLALAKLVRGNPDAEAGLRRAVVNYLIDNFQTSRPTSLGGNDFLSAAKFRDFVDTHNRAFRVLFGGQGRQNIERVASMLRRQQFSAEVAKGSPTAAAQVGLKGLNIGHPTEGHPTAIAVIMEQIGDATSHLLGHSPIAGKVVGATSAIISMIANKALQAGIKNRNDLLAEAFLHPNLAAELAQKATNGKVAPIAARRIAAQLGAIATLNSRPKDQNQ